MTGLVAIGLYMMHGALYTSNHKPKGSAAKRIAEHVLVAAMWLPLGLAEAYRFSKE